MQLEVITNGLRTLLNEQHYNPKTLVFYEREWKKIHRFLLDEYGNSDFDMERGLKYLENHLGTNPTVRLHGKGNKYRTVVVSIATANLVESYIIRCRKNAPRDHPLITNRYNQKLDRDGVSYMVQKYTDEIRKEDYCFPEKVHCHMFRHSKGMHMLAAGINIVYIRDFLGHEDISVTMVYAKADNRLKNEAINKLAPKVIESTDYPDWSKDHDLMDFLNSLK